MDEASNGDMNMDNHGTQGLFSTMPLDNDCDFNIDIDELYDLIQEPSMNTDIISNTSIENVAPNYQNFDISEIPLDLFLNKQPMTTDIIPSTSIENAAPNHQSFDISEMPYDLFLSGQPMTNDIIPSTSIENVPPNYQNSDISEIPYDLFLNGHPMTNDIIPSTSIENVAPNHQNSDVSEIPSNSSIEKGFKNSSSRRTYQVTVDEHDGYSLSYIYSMGVKYISMLQEEGGTNKIGTSDGKDQENPKINNFISMPILMEKEGDIHISSGREQENPRTNSMIFQQPMPKIPILENLEREFMKSKFPIDHTRREQENPRTNVTILNPPMPEISILMEKESDFMKQKLNIVHSFGISTIRTGEQGKQGNPNTNGLILQQPMPHIPTLEKLKNDIMKSKLSIDHQFGTSISRREEQGKPKTSGLIPQQPMPTIPILEKLKSDSMNPKLMPGHSFGTPTTRREQKYKQEIDSGCFKSVISSNKEDEIRYEILNSLDDVQLAQNSSFNGGSIRRLPNKTTSRYQPFGRQNPKKQGSDRITQSSLESTFNGSPQVGEESIICKWEKHLEEIKRKTGIAGDFARSSYHSHMILNYMQRKSPSSQVAETEKQDSNNEEALVEGRSSKSDNHSNQNFEHSPNNTHEITEKFKGIASGRNVNQDTQGYDYANQAITLGRWNNRINEDGAHDQLQSFGVQSFNTENTHFNWA